ncbi:MAG: hypothetical protein EBR82_86725 [Caulobacteraceae bacterium]|nr:hypothetical protein [Caulobacteraceae bacterium]
MAVHADDSPRGSAGHPFQKPGTAQDEPDERQDDNGRGREPSDEYESWGSLVAQQIAANLRSILEKFGPKSE